MRTSTFPSCAKACLRHFSNRLLKPAANKNENFKQSLESRSELLVWLSLSQLFSTADKKLEPLFRHQSMIGLCHVYAVEADELCSIRSRRQGVADLDDLDAGRARNLDRPFNRVRLD